MIMIIRSSSPSEWRAAVFCNVCAAILKSFEGFWGEIGGDYNHINVLKKKHGVGHDIEILKSFKSIWGRLYIEIP